MKVKYLRAKNLLSPHETQFLWPQCKLSHIIQPVTSALICKIIFSKEMRLSSLGDSSVLCFFSSEAPTWAQLKCNSWNLKLMLGKILRKQRIPVCLLQRNSWPFTNVPLCFPAPALLTSQTGNCVFPVAADHVLGTGRAGLSPHLPLLAVPWDHGTALLATLEFLLFFSNSYFKRLLLPHCPNKGIVLCMYLFLFSSCISG